MKLLDRYIGINVIVATFLALLVLIGMQSFISFVAELHTIGTRNYGLAQAFIYVPMLLPSYAYQFFPIAGLLGVLMGLGRLASQSELIAMRAAGISVTQVIWAVAKAGILMLVIITFLGEWWAPHLQFRAERDKAIALTGGQALGTQQGTWVRDGNNFIYINTVQSKGKLLGVMRYEIGANHRLILASQAESGDYVNGQWIFNKVQQSTFENEKITNQQFPQQSWNVNFNPHLLNAAAIDPSQQTLNKLYSYIEYLKNNNQLSNQSEFQLWKRIFQPLATLIMIILGVPFVFGPLRTATMGLKILIGVIVGFSFYMLNEFFGPLSMVYQVPPILAAAMPAAIFVLGGSILLWKAR